MTTDHNLLSVFKTVATRVDKRDFSHVTSESVITELGIDSLSMMQIVGEMEQEFDVMLPDDELVALQTVGELCDKVGKKISEKGAAS